MRFFLHQGLGRAVELVNGELEPELVLLVNNDKEQLIVRAGLQGLRREKPLKPEIASVCVCHIALVVFPAKAGTREQQGSERLPWTPLARGRR